MNFIAGTKKSSCWIKADWKYSLCNVVLLNLDFIYILFYIAGVHGISEHYDCLAEQI